jgi:deoxyribodipyrimidine photolyase
VISVLVFTRDPRVADNPAVSAAIAGSSAIVPLIVVQPGAVRPPGRPAYQVFTPYYSRWLTAPRRPALPRPRSVTLPAGIDTGRLPELCELTGTAPAPSGWRGGEQAGLRRLRQWVAGDAARYPSAHLVDGDIACNQLNWQWVAGTGTDTRPARMLSPVLQSHRHDSSGGYVRRWVPELAHLLSSEIREPGRASRRAAGYPELIIDHHEAAAAYRTRVRPAPA